MKQSLLKERTICNLRGHNKPSIVILGKNDVDKILKIVDKIEVGSLYDRDTGHYEDNSQDLVVYWTGFDRLPIFSKDCVVRGALRVLKPGGIFILRMIKDGQDISRFKEYLLDLNSHLAMINVDSKTVYMEIQKDESGF